MISVYFRGSKVNRIVVHNDPLVDAAVVKLMQGILQVEGLTHPHLGKQIEALPERGDIKVNGHNGFVYTTLSGRKVRYIPQPEGPRIEIDFRGSSRHFAGQCLRYLTGLDVEIEDVKRREADYPVGWMTLV